MAEQRVYNGYIYTRNSPSDPWTIAGPAQPASGARQATVVSNPFRQREEQRKEEDQQFQRNSDRRAAEAEERAARAEARADAAEQRARENDDQKRKTNEARGGIETTESERNAAFLATRLAGGLRDLGSLGDIGAPSLRDALTGGTLIGNYFTDTNRQRAINAQREILDSALTLGTGAAYTQEQIDSYRSSYFPQPGDKPETVADKNRRLQTVLQAARLKSGAAGGLIDDALSAQPPAAPTFTNKPVVQSDPRGNLQPDGTFERDGGLYDRDGNYLGLALTVTDDSPQSAPPPGPQGSEPTWDNSYLSQGLSGLNEGIAGTLGLPVDIATAGLNLIPKGVNAIANTNLPEISDPFLGGQWWNRAFNDIGAVRAESSDPSKQFVRRTAQSVGSSLIPTAAVETNGARIAQALLASAGGGAGAATAQQIAPGNPYAEFAGELAGSVGTGAGLLAANRRSAQRGIEAAIPTVDELKEQASSLYRNAENSGLTADPSQTGELATSLTDILRSEGRVSPTGRISEVYPKAKEAMQLVGDYSGLTMTPKQMQTVRSVIADGAGSPDASERRMAQLLLGGFDEWADAYVPQLANARAVSSRYLNAQKLEQARELAQADASNFSGSGLENALRTRYRQLDRGSIQGKQRFSDDVIDAIENVSRGTTASNVARGIGRLAPTGSVSFGLGTVAPAGVATALLGPVGGAATLTAIPAIGAVGRKAAENMALRGADVAELVARNGGAIEQAPLVDQQTQKIIAALLSGQQGQYLPQENEGPGNRGY